MSIANAHRWQTDDGVGWLVQAGDRNWFGDAPDRQTANDQIMAMARAAGCPAVIITARHPNEGRPCHG